jgi:hypothetical protein
MIRDVLGKEIVSGSIKPNIETEIDGKYFGNGIYFVTLFKDGKIFENRKLLIIE